MCITRAPPQDALTRFPLIGLDNLINNNYDYAISAMAVPAASLSSLAPGCADASAGLPDVSVFAAAAGQPVTRLPGGHHSVMCTGALCTGIIIIISCTSYLCLTRSQSARRDPRGMSIAGMPGSSAHKLMSGAQAHTSASTVCSQPAGSRVQSARCAAGRAKQCIPNAA